MDKKLYVDSDVGRMRRWLGLEQLFYHKTIMNLSCKIGLALLEHEKLGGGRLCGASLLGVVFEYGSFINQGADSNYSGIASLAAFSNMGILGYRYLGHVGQVYVNIFVVIGCEIMLHMDTCIFMMYLVLYVCTLLLCYVYVIVCVTHHQHLAFSSQQQRSLMGTGARGRQLSRLGSGGLTGQAHRPQQGLFPQILLRHNLRTQIVVVHNQKMVGHNQRLVGHSQMLGQNNQDQLEAQHRNHSLAPGNQ